MSIETMRRSSGEDLVVGTLSPTGGLTSDSSDTQDKPGEARNTGACALSPVPPQTRLKILAHLGVELIGYSVSLRWRSALGVTP